MRTNANLKCAPNRGTHFVGVMTLSLCVLALPSGVASAKGDTKTAPSKKYMLGIHVKPAAFGGIQITKLFKNSPLRSLTSTDGRTNGKTAVGDIIMAIDGVPQKSLKDYRKAMRAAVANKGWVRVSIFHQAKIKEMNWRVQALVVKPKSNDKQPTPTSTRRAHIILCGLTDDKSIGPKVETNLQNMEQAIRDATAKLFIASLQIVKGAACSRAGIKKALAEIRVEPDDAVFFYYAGHGAYDPTRAKDDPSGGHFFIMPNVDLMRKELWSWLSAHNARLTVLLTDTCSVKSQAHVVNRQRPSVSYHRVNKFMPLEHLLLFRRGHVDVSGSAKDQYGWYSGAIGGWFTHCLRENLNGTKSWRALVANTGKSLSKFYSERRKQLLGRADTAKSMRTLLERQSTQQPHVFRMKVFNDEIPDAVPPPTRTVRREFRSYEWRR